MPRIVSATAVAVALAAVALLPAGASAAGNSCSATQFRQIVRQEFQPWWEPVENRWRLRRCLAGAPNVKTLRAMKRIRENFERGKARAVERYQRLTPYGRWAIPGYIVMCESHGYWNAANPSGAVGPYQLLGWGAPYPVDSMPEKMEHHRLARYVLSVQGYGAWVCA